MQVHWLPLYFPTLIARTYVDPRPIKTYCSSLQNGPANRKKQKGASKLCRQLDVVKDRKSPKKIVCYLAITTICLGAQIEVHTRNRIYREKILVYIYYFPILNHIWRGGGVV